MSRNTPASSSPPPAPTSLSESVAAPAEVGQVGGTHTTTWDSQRFGMSAQAKRLFALLARKAFLHQVPPIERLQRIFRVYGTNNVDRILFWLDIEIQQQAQYLISGEVVAFSREVVA